ncbi:hypothetical protein Taro_016529 [Colocasia esculenta]|uniref:Nodulin-like domain-containing protein n=1 Tax=Colocasia esculenta TaxID=4460 RepID=A0A843UE24_COLES|nr:hypothetical protein [Colocasia esculenta]
MGATGDGDGWRWAALAAAVWIQAAAGTNFDFPAYSTGLKAALGASQAGLNGLAVASDMGKALGWSSGLAALHSPLPAVTGAAAAMGLAGYGIQWLFVAGYLRLHYTTVFVTCLVAGCSICWFNTACFALCTRAFPSPRRRALALSLSVSFNGASAALYALLASAGPGPPVPSVYLLLNALVPLVVSLAALPPSLRYSSPTATEDDDDDDTGVFLALHAFAFLTGVYLLVLTPFSSGSAATARLLLAGAAVLLLLPVFAPTVLRACHRNSHTKKKAAETNVELFREQLLGGDSDDGASQDSGSRGWTPRKSSRWFRFLEVEGIIGTDQLATLGEEHTAGRLLRRVDFWLYYVGYLCGATVGLVYSNNLGQIAESLGRGGDGTTALVGIYSACSFFGRLLSSFPDLISSNAKENRRLARTGWLAAGLAPMPVAFFLLAGGGSSAGVLLVCTAVVGLSSGFVFAAAVSVTAELFGVDSVGVNHNILVSNIPLGSLLYGLLAAQLYDSGARGGVVSAPSGGGGRLAVVCMGEQCYAGTFRWWGLITTVGVACSAALFLRTRAAYSRFFESRRRRAEKGDVWLDELFN